MPWMHHICHSNHGQTVNFCSIRLKDMYDHFSKAESDANNGNKTRLEAIVQLQLDVLCDQLSTSSRPNLTQLAG
jgi:hypothetical protein